MIITSLPTKNSLDLDAFSDAQLVALHRIIDESGRVELGGVAFADVQERVHRRMRNNDFAWTVEALERAYREVSDYLFAVEGTVGMSPLVG